MCRFISQMKPGTPSEINSQLWYCNLFTIICNIDVMQILSPLDKSGSIICSTTKKTYNSKGNNSCKSSNLIYQYCITCKKCSKQYIGQTKRTLAQRFQGHFYNINLALSDLTTEKHLKASQDTIGSHFSSPDHQGTSDISIHIVDLFLCHLNHRELYK